MRKAIAVLVLFGGCAMSGPIAAEQPLVRACSLDPVADYSISVTRVTHGVQELGGTFEGRFVDLLPKCCSAPTVACTGDALTVACRGYSEVYTVVGTADGEQTVDLEHTGPGTDSGYELTVSRL